jgi:hypothetical protein
LPRSPEIFGACSRERGTARQETSSGILEGVCGVGLRSRPNFDQPPFSNSDLSTRSGSRREQPTPQTPFTRTRPPSGTLPPPKAELSAPKAPLAGQTKREAAQPTELAATINRCSPPRRSPTIPAWFRRPTTDWSTACTQSLWCPPAPRATRHRQRD